MKNGNRGKKIGHVFTPEKAYEWVISGPFQGKKLTERDLFELDKLKKALRAERPELPRYWGQVQRTLAKVGCPYGGLAIHLEACNDFCEFMKEEQD